MKNFIKEFLLVIIISLGLLFIINYIGEQFIPREEMMAYDNLSLEKIPKVVKFVNFGNSHGQRSFKYSEMGETVYNQSFNFGLTAQSLVYDSKLALYYQDHFVAEDGVVFIPISFFSLYSDEMVEDGVEQKNNRYYPYLDREHMRMWNFKDALLHGEIYYHFPILRFADKEIGSILYLKEEWTETQKKVEDNSKGIRSENKEAVNTIIELFQSKNYRIILLTTPIQDEFIQEWGDKYINQYYKDINTLINVYNVEYWDFSKLFENRKELFIDSHHLSEEGANQFTKTIFEKLQSLDARIKKEGEYEKNRHKI